MKNNYIRLVSSLLLLLTALVWGIAFVAQSVGMDYVGPWTFVFSRFLVSAIVLLPVSWYSEKHLRDRKKKEQDPQNAGHDGLGPQDARGKDKGADREEKGRSPRDRRVETGKETGETFGTWKRCLFSGACCGLFLGLASIAQQSGIQYTTAGKAGFITALYVVIVPVLGIFAGKRPSGKIWFCVLLGIAGLYLISVKEGFTVGRGDIRVMLCAFLFSCQILNVDHFSPRVENVILLANLQFMFAAVVGLAGMLLFEEPKLADILAAAVPILYAGAMSGAVGYTLQIVAQKNTDPAIAALLMSLESVFSAIAGWLLLHQVLSSRELAGCAIVLAAVILAQLPVGG